MRKRSYYQCQECGCVHYIEEIYDIEQDMYEQRICIKCGKVATHLWVGNDPEDFYILYNPNLDERFFIY